MRQWGSLIIDRIIHRSRTNWIGLAGSLMGLVSLLLPWGSIVVRDPDTHTTMFIGSLGIIDLVGSSFTLAALGSLLFALSTVVSLFDRRAVAGQITALAAISIALPELMALRVEELAPVLPDGMLSTSTAIGFFIGLFSILILLLSFVPFKEVDHGVQTGLIGSERLRPEENSFHAWKRGPYR